jgi:cobalt-zinc-cadmium efflux system outer membrane protein
VLPGSERAVEALRRGYEEGRFTLVEVLEAERARLDAGEQYLRALIEAHHSAQHIERLTGIALELQP